MIPTKTSGGEYAITAALVERGAPGDARRQDCPEYPEYWQNYAEGDANREIVGITRSDILAAVDDFITGEGASAINDLNRVLFAWLQCDGTNVRTHLDDQTTLMGIQSLQAFLAHLLDLNGNLQQSLIEAGAIEAMRQMGGQSQQQSSA